MKERPSEKRWRAEIANQQEFFPLIRARGCATRPQNSMRRCKFAACESVMNSLMKWVWRLRATRWLRCHFRRGCGAAVSYGAGSDNEISASSLPLCHFLIIPGSSGDCTLPLAGFKQLKRLLTGTGDHQMVLFIVPSESICQFLWQIYIGISVNVHLYRGLVSQSGLV